MRPKVGDKDESRDDRKKMEEEFTKIVAPKLREAREKCRLSRQKASEELLISPQSLQNYENGARIPDALTITKMATLYQVDLNAILDTKQEVIKKATHPFEEVTGFLNDARSLGIRWVNKTRDDAIKKLKTELEAETSLIRIAGTSLKGITEHTSMHDFFEFLKQKKEDSSNNIDIEILLISPLTAMLRELGERREPNKIREEINESYTQLINHGISTKNIYFYPGSCTCFMLATSNFMIINPYTHTGYSYQEAFCITVEKKNQSHEGVYDLFLNSNFKKAKDHASVWLGDPPPFQVIKDAKSYTSEEKTLMRYREIADQMREMIFGLAEKRRWGGRE